MRAACCPRRSLLINAAHQSLLGLRLDPGMVEQLGYSGALGGVEGEAGVDKVAGGGGGLDEELGKAAGPEISGFRKCTARV